MAYYPIMLNIRGKQCLVVGGGEVARRKVASLLECEAKVTVIAAKVCADVENLGKDRRIRLLNRKYRRGDINGFFLVIAATDSPQVNKEVAFEAREQGILVNVVDHLKISSFTVPSVLRRGDLTVAIGTGGKSPLLAKKLRKHLDRLLPSEYEELLEELWNSRELLKEENLSAFEKRRIYEEIINSSGLL